VISTTFGMSVNTVIWLCRIALLTLPVVSALVAYRLCKELVQRDGPLPSNWPDEPVVEVEPPVTTDAP
jgi:hypothetical protein